MDKEKRDAAMRLINHLKEQYHYKPVPITLEMGDVRQVYKRLLPDWCKLEGEEQVVLRTNSGTPVLNGYKRIVIGDYGAFIEAAPEQANRKYVRVKSGQEYRMSDPQYASCKYIWLTATDDSNVKIYFQKHTVEYADYVPGMLYISPYELFPVHPV